MIVREILQLTWFLVIFFVSGCFYVPKIEENKNENCELITKSMTIENEVKNVKVEITQSTIKRDGNIPNTTKVPVFFSIIALFVWFTGLSGVYAFIERIGSESGIDGLTIGIILSFTKSCAGSNACRSHTNPRTD